MEIETSEVIYSLCLNKEDIENMIICIDDSLQTTMGIKDEDIIIHQSDLIKLKRKLKISLGEEENNEIPI